MERLGQQLAALHRQPQACFGWGRAKSVPYTVSVTLRSLQGEEIDPQLIDRED